MLVVPTNNCCHITSLNLIPLSEFSKIPFHILKCENCSENYELWICISCGKSFCGRYKNNHCYLHYALDTKNSHSIFISFLDFSIWCHQCDNNFFNDKGNYITNNICDKYIDILSQFKFSIYYNPSIDDIFNSMDLNKEQIKNIKYNNFIELLKNNKLNKITFLVGAGISTSSGIPDFRGTNGVFIDIMKKYNLKRAEEFFSKNNFLEKPELLYDYLKQFKSKEYFPNITHFFMKYLIDKNKCELIFTQNFDGLEVKSGINKNNIVFAHGTLTEGHCISCNENIDINIINQGINESRVIKCEKCGGPCKPKIVLYNEDLPEIFYEKADYAKECDVGIIIGTELVVEPFSRLINKFNKNAWIIIINKNFVGDFDCYNILNKQLFLEGYCDDIIKQILTDCGWLDDFNNKYLIKK